jgi:Pyridoxamine 5'-phosphate oxidase
MEDDQALAKELIDSNLYMTLGTADESGRPWASPVYYAPDGYREFFWVSRPESQHSRNLVVRPELGIVIFDSTVPINTGRGVYMTAVGELVADVELERGLAIFSERSQSHGGEAWTPADLESPEPLRLYHAIASDYSVIRPRTTRTPVTWAAPDAHS